MSDNSSKQSPFLFGTITLKPDFYTLTIKNQILKSYDIVAGMLQSYECDFGLAYELTKVGNIHYHFELHLTNVDLQNEKNLLLDFLKTKRATIHKKYFRLFGYCKIDIVNQDNGITNYLIKDMHKTEYVLRKRIADSKFHLIYPIYLWTKNGERSSRLRLTKHSLKNYVKLVTEDLFDLDQVLV